MPQEAPIQEGQILTGPLFNEPMQVETVEEVGRAAADVEKKTPGAEGRLARAENRHADLMARRERRRQELERQRSLSLQVVERIASVLVLPHPEGKAPEIQRMRPNPEAAPKPQWWNMPLITWSAPLASPMWSSFAPMSAAIQSGLS